MLLALQTRFPFRGRWSWWHRHWAVGVLPGRYGSFGVLDFVERSPYRISPVLALRSEAPNKRGRRTNRFDVKISQTIQPLRKCNVVRGIERVGLILSLDRRCFGADLPRIGIR